MTTNKNRLAKLEKRRENGGWQLPKVVEIMSVREDGKSELRERWTLDEKTGEYLKEKFPPGA